jgi:hypothetical protein
MTNSRNKHFLVYSIGQTITGQLGFPNKEIKVAKASAFLVIITGVFAKQTLRYLQSD